MIDKAKQKIHFISDIDTVLKERTQQESPDWLASLREQSLSRFAEIGIPTVQDEEWKYTNVKPIIENTFEIGKSNELIEMDAFNTYCKDDPIKIVFVNGILSDTLTTIDKVIEGVTITNINKALEKNADDIQKLISKYDANEACAFVSLNSALNENGVFIKVDKNINADTPIHIVHVTSASNGETLTLPRTLITVEKSAQATVLESHIAFTDDITYFSNALTDIFLAENATLNYVKAQKESLKAYHIGNTRVWQEKNSNLLGFSLMTGSAITRNNLDIVLNGEGINSTLDGLYSNFGDQHVDNHTAVDHRFPNCTSNQLYKGILNESSRAVFNGKIFVKPIAQQTNSYQLNKNLLLGQDCRVDTKPQLEIFADDVKCTHGATIGQLNEDEIFYLQTRCISKEEAVRMLAKGFVDDLVDTIKDESINRKLHILLEPSFARL